MKYLARGTGYGLFLTPNETILRVSTAENVEKGTGHRLKTRALVSSATIRQRLVGANTNPAMHGESPLPGTSNYLIGNNPNKWRTGIPHYSRVRYEDVYPGIDLVYHGTRGQLEYDFVVAPGADPKRIGMEMQGADKLGVDEAGNLVLETAGRKMVQQAPEVYQEQAGRRQVIPGRYLLAEGRVGFELGAYDVTHPLVIDPILTYSSFLGGSDSDQGFRIAVDGEGQTYLLGTTLSTDFPTANPVQAANGGGFFDLFVAKLNKAGTELVYSTYLGGNDSELGNSTFGLAVDEHGQAVVTGFTASTDFPVVHALQPTAGGNGDGFVAKLAADGTRLIYPTYLGGSDFDHGYDVALDRQGNAYVTGTTSSPNFPVAHALQPTLNGPSDVFITKLSKNGKRLRYSTYLGGSDFDDCSFGGGIEVDREGQAYVTGDTCSTDFPTTVGVLQPDHAPIVGFQRVDGFVAKLSGNGKRLLYSTYLGGSRSDNIIGLALDDEGNAYVTGGTNSSDFPTANPLQAVYGGRVDAFVAKLNENATKLVYSTYLGKSSF